MATRSSVETVARSEESLFMPSAKPVKKQVPAEAPVEKPRSSRSASPPRETAESMAGKQKEIAVSEFFAKNRHLLGFDNPRKALLTTVKEAVDNSLDACEEAGILPEIWVKIEALNGGKTKKADDKDAPALIGAPVPEAGVNLNAATRFRVTVRDNGPGIVKQQIPNVFGRLLYGSKFHRLRMSRGQQGIGISAAGMYGLLTTGQSVTIISRTGRKKPAHRFELQMDTLKNRADIVSDEELPTWIADGVEMDQGTEVSIVLEAKFQRGRASVDEYMEQTAIANPHALFHYTAPDGQHRDFPREVHEVPPSPEAILPHPYGVELGVLIRMLRETNSYKLGAFLQNEFSCVGPAVAKEICTKAGLTVDSYCSRIAREEADALHKAIQETKIKSPPTTCLVPIGAQQILKGLLKEIKAEFYTAETREPSVYRGNPFQVEVGIAYGGQLPADEPARVIRFANRVPLLYQPAACAITRGTIDTNWRNYGLSQPRNSLPEGPLVVFVHIASVWVPFTSESKEAVAGYDEIMKEISLALMTCGRKLKSYINKRKHIARESQRRHIFERYIGELVMAVERMTKVDAKKLYEQLQAVARSRTESADTQFDEDGNVVKEQPDTAGEIAENTVVIEANQADSIAGADGSVEPTTSSSPGRGAKQLFDDSEAA